MHNKLSTHFLLCGCYLKMWHEGITALAGEFLWLESMFFSTWEVYHHLPKCIQFIEARLIISILMTLENHTFLQRSLDFIVLKKIQVLRFPKHSFFPRKIIPFQLCFLLEKNLLFQLWMSFDMQHLTYIFTTSLSPLKAWDGITLIGR